MNVRFGLILMEFQSLRDYVALLERNLPGVIERESAIKAGLADLGVDELATYDLAELQSGVTTRLIGGSAITALWAAYESAVLYCATYLQQRREVRLSLQDLRGSFLERARQYFDDVLKFDLHPPETTDWDRLRLLAELRNSFAHDNGVYPGSRARRAKRLREWVAATPGLSIADGYVVPQIAFVREATAHVAAVVGELINRTRDS